MFKEWYKSRLNSGKVDKIQPVKSDVVPLLSIINQKLDLAKSMKDEDLNIIASDHSSAQKDRVDDTYHKVNSPKFQDFEDAMTGKTPMVNIDTDKGESVKVIHKIKDDHYLSRPYHGKTDIHNRVLPLSGWGIITTNNLYKEAGLADLCEQAALSTIKHGGIEIPLTVIKFNKTHDKSGNDFLAKRKPHRDENTIKLDDSDVQLDQDNRFKVNPAHARKIGLMDYLTGNYDRNASNIMVRSQHDENGHKPLLAIDHDRAFHYVADETADPHEHFLRSAISRVLKNDAAITSTPEHDGHLADWWNSKKTDIHDEMRRSLESIKDHKLRAHINGNFQTRFKIIDQWATDYNKNPRSLFVSSETTRHTPVIPLDIIDPAHVQLIEQSLPERKDSALTLLIDTLKENLDPDKKETILHIAKKYGKQLNAEDTIKFLQKEDSNQDVIHLKTHIANLSLSDPQKVAAVLAANEGLPKDNRFLSPFYVNKIKKQLTGAKW